MEQNITVKKNSFINYIISFFKYIFCSSHINEYAYSLLKIKEVSPCKHIFKVQISKMNKIFYIKTEDFIKKTSLVANFSPSDIYLMTHYALKDKLLPSTKYVSYNEETNIVTFKNLKNNNNIEKNISEVLPRHLIRLHNVELYKQFLPIITLL